MWRFPYTHCALEYRNSAHHYYHHLSYVNICPFQIPNEGSLALVISLIVLQGVTGISFGLVISSAIDDEQSANQAALGIFYPNLIISGTLSDLTDVKNEFDGIGLPCDLLYMVIFIFNLSLNLTHQY